MGRLASITGPPAPFLGNPIFLSLFLVIQAAQSSGVIVATSRSRRSSSNTVAQILVQRFTHSRR